MAVRSYSPFRFDQEHATKRKAIDRSNKHKAPTANSKTQRRKQNKSAHMQTTKQFK